MDASFTYISQHIISISIIKRMVGVKPRMSSMIPIYNMISMAAISMKMFGLLSTVCEQHKPIVIPKNTAGPPMFGIGLRCSFLASGLSTRFLAMAIFSIFGCIQSVPKNANNAGKIIWYMFGIALSIVCYICGVNVRIAIDCISTSFLKLYIANIIEKVKKRHIFLFFFWCNCYKSIVCVLY